MLLIFLGCMGICGLIILDPANIPEVHNVTGCTTDAFGLTATLCPTAGAVEITIRGVNFRAPLSVFVGSRICPVNSFDLPSMTVKCQLPAGAGLFQAVKLPSVGQLSNNLLAVS
jgi:hypothetical protein